MSTTAIAAAHHDQYAIARPMTSASRMKVCAIARVERTGSSRVSAASVSGGSFLRTSLRNSSPAAVAITVDMAVILRLAVGSRR